MKKILLKFFLLMLLLGVLFITPVNAAPPNSPLNPQCEGETNPLLIDNTIPEFSWIFDDPDGGDTQSAYQILVSTSNDNLVLDIGDMWNSGKVLLSSSTVSYSGSELQSGTNYYWKVRTWDVGDSAGFYCSIQTFKMAFFLLKQTLNTSDSSYSIVLGDIDNDGDLDSIVGNRSEANRIFKNDGSGSFSSFQTSAETDYTLSLAIGDIDNDGDIDYVAGNNSNVHGNRIYKNDGTGNFDLFGTSDEADYTMSVALGDIDNDGDLDYIVGNNSNVHGNRVYKNDGTGNFSLFGTSEEADYTMSVALGDIDNDGDLDLVVGNRGYNRIYKNNGIGDFSLFETSEESDATYSVALGDIDNDGDLDYVAGNSNSEGNSVYKNDGTGCFSFVEISTETKNTASIAFIDIDNDGDLDYIAANNSSATDDIYINNGTGSFNLLESTNANDSSTCVAVGDIDNDNDLDYIISTYRYGTQVYFSGESFDNPNSTPLPPSSGLNSNYAGGIVTLTWDPGTDTETPASGLYYNIRIGTVSASGDTVSGVYGTPLLGNYLGSKIGASQLGVKLCSLPDNTTFYWSVQTIDSNLEKSSWSTEQSFFCPNVEPGAITDLAAIPWYETGEINLTWTAPGDDGDKGETASYIVKYSTFQFSDQTSFDNAAAYAQSWTPLWAGQTENKIITGFMGGTTYYFAIEALDDASNQASLSNIDGNNSTCATVEDITEPGTITTLVVSSWAQVKFKWIAPGDNDYDTDGLASGYIVKYSISGNITNDTEFNNAATYSQTWIPASPGTEEEKDINGLNPGLVYYFSIKTYDENNNYSSISETTNSSAVAGNFSIDTSQDIIDVSNASLAWGDYDEDGDMDLAICGYDGVSLHTRIYRNDNGTMIFFQSLTGVKSRYSTQQLAWGDYDGDGDLDLFMCGAVNSSESSFITRIYRNDNGTFNQDIGQSLPGACSLDIADYDNDGDIDLALMGGTNNTDIYRNDNGIFFKDTQQSLSGKAHGTLAWGDYDNDGDQDLLMGGETSGWPPDRDFILYRNDDGILIDSELFSYGRACFSIKWVDFDNDGDLDIAISDEYNTELLRNNNGSFTYLRRFSEDSGSVSWGDYDNDGDLDLFLAGYDWQGGIKIFRNDNGEFTETHEFEKFSGGPCVTWVDYDNDGDLDICLAGYRSSEDYDYETRIYKNMQSEFISSSSRPEPPVSYNTYYDNKLNFRWDPGVDTETPTDGLYYNIRVGTTLGGDDIVSGSYGASLFGNYLRPKISSATLGITLNMTEPTTYYWAVQTIDTSLQRSLWGEEQIWSASYIDQPPDEPTLPQCENQTNPTNIGTLTPAFSWMFNDPNMDDQYAYQIIVSSDPATLALDIGDRWDSGKVVLSTNTAVYNGSPLYGDVTYWWKVRTWDADVSTGPYCSAQTFKVSIAVLNQAVTEDDPTLDIAIGDIDGDGDLDMICVNFYAVNRIYKNDGGIFSLHQSPGGAYDTQALAVGDIDNDGDLDYVTGNREQANRVYKNNGSGDFSYYQSSSETDYTYALDLGDIDGDGDLDLVVGNYNLNSSNRIYKNNGSGSFSLFYTFEEKDNTADLALGDIDNDGDLDLVVGNSAFNCLRIYKNDGIGNFSLFDNPDGAGSGYSLALGDIDNDGDLDLLTGNCIFKNDGVGNFSLFATTDDYANSYAIALGDIDNDGDLDYVKGYKWGEYMTIRLNDGTGNFSLYETIPDQDYIYALALGDLDNDGGLDIVAGKAGNAYSSGRIYYYPEPNRIYFSNTHSSNQNQSPSAPLSFNANYSSSVLTLDWGNGSDVETSSGGLYYNIKVGTSSGDDDIIQGLYSSPRLGNYLRPKISSTTLGVNIRNLPEGTTTYWSVRTIDSGLSVSPWSTEQSIILPDQIPNSPGNMRCENLIDPMAVYDTTPELSWEYDGGQSQGAYQILVSTSSINLAGDIGDKWDTGKVNSSNNNVSYAGSSLSADTTYFWKVRTWDTSASSGTYCSEQKFRMAFFYLQQTSAESDYTYAVALGDLDNDGDLDYIAGNCSNPFDEFYNRIYKNNGTGSFSLFETASEKNYTNSLAVGDIDNDGDLDYIAGAYNRTNSIYVNNGSGSFTLKESSIENDQTYSVAVGDIDNDGDMDYIAGNHGLNRVYKNDGTGCFSSFLNSQENDSTRAVVIGDIDNDGDMDYIAGNYDQSNRVYKNNGNGNFTLWESSIETDNTYSLILGDIDNDGDLDLAVGNYGQSNRVYTNNGDGNFSLYDTSIESDYTYSIGLGDVDNDGDLDLLCGNYGASYDYQSNKLYENDGTGKFTIWQLSMEEDSTRSIAIGDIDNDGDLDYICGNSSSYTNTRNKIYISKKALSNPNSSPSAPVVLSNDYSEGVLSFTWGDGTDIETSSTGLYYSIRVGTYSSSGNIISGVHGSPLMGNYIRPHISSTTLGINLNNLPTQTTYYWSIRTIDTGLTASSWSVEQSTYIATTNQPPNSPQSLQCENRTNPIVVSDTTPEFSWIFSDSNIGDGDFQTAYQILVSSNLANINVDIGDVWDSGKVLSSQSNNISYNGVSLLAQTTYWWKVRCWDQDDSTGTYCSNQTFTMGFFFWKEDYSDTDNTRTITIGDVDNDGDMDYIAGNYSGYDEVYTNDGTGSFTKQEITYYGDRTVSLALGDIDNDGDLDYIVGNDIINMSGSNVYGKRILKNDGEGNYSVINSTEHSTGNMYCVNMGDIDNDGDIDYIAGVAENQANQICINDGSGNFSIKEVSSETDSTMCIAIYDIDSDGDLDYIAGNYGGNRVYTNDGTGSFSLYQTLTESDDTDCIVFGDIDNDGDIDFIAGNNSASNRTYKNDGAGNFSLFQTSVEQDTSRSLSLGDIDNDGDLDLVCGNLAGANRIYTNDGTGVFALIETNIEIDNTYAIGLVDIEDDGDLDLIVGNGGINSVFYSDKAASIPNTMPSSPSSGFTDNYADGELTLSWGDGSDTETGTSGLYYSIRIGTGPGGDNIVAESYASPLLGNYIRPMISTTTLGIKIKNLTPDVTYYWSIKTIDAGLSQSAWSIEQEAESLYIAPSNITDLTSSSGYDPGEVKLSWTATGDNGGTGDITEGKYRVHYSSNALDTWDTSPYSLEWSMNTSPGNTDEKTVTGLTGGTTYYFWIKIADEVPLWSDVSNKTSSSAQTGDTTDPATINDLVATGCEQIKLVWTAPGDNGWEGTAANYEVKYATYNITSEALYNSAVTYVQSWTPLIGGSQEEKSIIGLIRGQTYYFSVKAYDEVALSGGISNTTGNEAISTNFYNDLAQTLTGVSESCLAWGDYDSDGDLDLVLCGESGTGKITKVYRNDAGILNEVQSLTGVSYGALSWGDYDNDGDLDLALCGDSTIGRISKIYRNDAGTFNEVQSLTGIEKGSIGWADIDNDGDLDLAVSGEFALGGSSKIYRNDGGTFVEVQSLTGVERSALSWGDYDMDGDMDLVLSGYTGLVRITKIFRNEGATLIENQNLVGIDSGALSWGDYDADGDLDLALMGNPGSQRIAKIYRNDNGTFVEDTGQGLTGVDEGSLEWGDYDNDGDLDLAICGDTGAGYSTKIYRNTGGMLSLIQELTGIKGSLKWGDYDLDGDLDLAICGDTDTGRISRLYKNTEADPSLGNNANSQPNAPGVLSSGYSDGVLTLTWNDGVDVESSANNLYYNVRVGTQSASNDAVSGTYGSPLLGNYLRPKTTSGQLGIKITNLMEGTTYYWSLQSIDGGLRRSAWAGEESIYIPDSIPGAPIFPQCEGETNPEFIYDITPEFSWVYQGSVNQGAYQVLVATDSAILASDIGNMWDSGKVSSSASTDISYAGSDLQGGTTYYWKVRCWDIDGSTGPYCGAQTFATNFFLNRESSVQTDNTNSIVFGDIDNDGDLDYIAGNNGSNRVYKNNGNAAFSLFQTPSGSYNTQAIAIGDMDNDGDLDYVDGAYNSRVRVYKNDGAGTFSSFYTSPTNYYTYSCALVDIDNDGDLDVIQGTDGQNRIYENDGTGTLSLIQSSAENDDTRSIAIGDIDNDGDLDYIAGNYGQVNRIYMNDGSGSFSLSSNSAEYDYTRVVLLGDIDNDGDLDLIYGNYSYANRIYKNDGTGSFNLWESSIEFDYTRSLSLGDIDNDGDLDLIAGIYNQPNRLYTNDGNGSFILYQSSYETDYTYTLALGDLNNDGDLDYVSGNYGQVNRVYTTGIAVSNANQTPSPPTSDFSSNYNYVTGIMTLNWGDGTDTETVSDGLGYQLRIGVVSYSGLGDDTILSGIYGSPLFGNYMRPQVSSTTLGINLNLPSGRTYYWSIKSIDSGLVSSNWSVEQISIVLSDVVPREPFGVKYRLLSDGRKRIEWSKVTNNEDGTVCNDLAGYNIYRSMQLNETWSRQNSSLITEEYWEEPENISGVVYYIVRAVDDTNNESINSTIVSSLEEAIFISEDSLTRVVIPKAISGILYKDSNASGDDVKIEINKGADTEEIIEVYTFTPVRANGEDAEFQLVEDFYFDLPEAEIIITYEVEGGIVKGSRGVREEQAGNKLALFRFNGLEWVKLGGKVSTEEDSISVKSKWLGSLCIMASERKEFDVTVRPRMFTPNGDRRNDICYIHFDNPGDKRNVSCRIYDLRSALVRDLPVVYTLGAGYFYWDGKDNSGRGSRSGIYIYQIEVGSKAINGTLVIAR